MARELAAGSSPDGHIPEEGLENFLVMVVRLSPLLFCPSLEPDQCKNFHRGHLYLENPFHDEGPRAGAPGAFICQEVPSPSPLLLAPLYNIPR